MNFTDEVNAMLNDEAIEESARTGMIITMGRALGMTDQDIMTAAYEMIDTVASDKGDYYDENGKFHISPLHAYSFLPRGEGEPNCKNMLIALIHPLVGSDDDNDDMTHDLEHALGMTDPCDVHSDQPCDRCCDPCFAD